MNLTLEHRLFGKWYFAANPLHSVSFWVITAFAGILVPVAAARAYPAGPGHLFARTFTIGIALGIWLMHTLFLRKMRELRTGERDPLAEGLLVKATDYASRVVVVALMAIVVITLNSR
ncbi:hypothetical protein ACPOL_3372 [Acidisarcina polymorpha]|uniref:Uncharacterized protein n=1 Tax=Acidisarcina polymorpha TaxID=2211140 RepID=A0A2Z5G0I0_9BACT|nr:hypothetical protein [Acidisarcina polymorpha]AXC12661.1 hypothetical protein ACPOL_3372 [Acidisarcina polymorpha]